MIGKSLAYLVILGGLAMCTTALAQPLDHARQLVLVTANDWSSPQGTLQRFQRKSLGERWQPLGSPVAVNLGRSGLGWGRGLHDPSIGQQGPAKKEGDGRSPAGAFDLPLLFGYMDGSSLAARSARLPYREAAPSLICVDDSHSGHYNQLIDRDQMKRPDWNSKEDMRRNDHQYAWGVLVSHNSMPAVPEGGSCIFIHVWLDHTTPTSGCTAGAAQDIAELFLWLDAKSRPVLVQLPVSEYQRLRNDWVLP